MSVMPPIPDEHQPHDLQRLCAEGEPDADFPRPLKHGVAEDPVDADNHEYARHHGEERGEQRQCTVPHEVVAHDRGLERDSSDAERGMRTGHFVPERRKQGSHLQPRADLNHCGILRPVRVVHGWRRRFPKVRVPRVPGNADHFLFDQNGSAIDAEESFAHCRFAREVATREALVHDDGGGLLRLRIPPLDDLFPQ